MQHFNWTSVYCIYSLWFIFVQHPLYSPALINKNSLLQHFNWTSVYCIYIVCDLFFSIDWSKIIMYGGKENALTETFDNVYDISYILLVPLLTTSWFFLLHELVLHREELRSCVFTHDVMLKGRARRAVPARPNHVASMMQRGRTDVDDFDLRCCRRARST